MSPAKTPSNPRPPIARGELAVKYLKSALRRVIPAPSAPANEPPPEHENLLIRGWWNDPACVRFIEHRLCRLGAPLLVVGTKPELSALAGLESRSPAGVRYADWDFGQTLPEQRPDEIPIVLPVPREPQHWMKMQAEFRTRNGRLRGLNEFALPFNILAESVAKLPYSVPDLRQLVSFYCGDNIFGGQLERLQDVFPIQGKRVIEFGPLDGLQTAFLVNHGAAAVTCIEARAENAMKVLVAKQVFDWGNVTLRSDDFHAVSSASTGRFDLAFAHGVYYHSVAPFVFLDNLINLADAVFLGGFCATDENPIGEFQQLHHGERAYRVKRYREGGRADFFAGVNTFGYFFQGDDLQGYFDANGFEVTVLEDLRFGPEQCAGRYIRLFAHRRTR
jgi:hypothetical protein